jgi:conjugal transfer/type IV secretion protein DotA/TraY
MIKLSIIKNKIWWLFFSLSAVVLACPACTNLDDLQKAVGSNASTLSTYFPSGSDVSVKFLQIIFGDFGTKWFWKAPDVYVYPFSGLFNKLFYEFNLAVLILAIMVVGYFIITELLHAAAKGGLPEGGKIGQGIKYARLILGVFVAVPLPNIGYSLIQMIFMWVVVIGVGAADHVWTAMIKYMQDQPITWKDIQGTASVPITQTKATEVTNELLSSLICRFNGYKAAQAGSSDPDSAPDAKNLKNILKVSNVIAAGTYDFDMQGYDFDQSIPMNIADGSNNTLKVDCGAILWPTWNSMKNKMQDLSAELTDSQNQGASTSTITNQISILTAKGYQYYAKNLQIYLNPGSKTPAREEDNTDDADKTSGQGLDADVSKLLGYDSKTGTPSYSGLVQVAKLYVYGDDNGNKVLPATQIEKDGSLKDNIKALYNSLVNNPDMATSTVITKDDWQKMLDNGWANAGSYFYQIANLGNAFEAVTSLADLQAPKIISGKFFTTADTQAVAAVTNEVIFGDDANDDDRSDGDSKTYKTDWFNKWWDSHAAVRNVLNYIGVFGQIMDIVSVWTKYYDNTKGQDIITGMWNIDDPQSWKVHLPTEAGQPFTHDYSKDVSKDNPLINPIIRVQMYGNHILFLANAIFETMYDVITALSTSVLGLVILIAGSVVFLTIALTAAPMVIGLCLLLLPPGMLMAVYVPMIPYIIFLFGVIGWMIAVFETMVAAPLVSIGLCLPSEGGADQVLGRAQPALQLLANVFLRPSLMIFGLAGGMVLSYVAIDFINTMFSSVAGLTSGSYPGWIWIIKLGQLFIYVSIILAVINRCFSLIHMVPDRVLSWLGWQSQFGEYAKGEEEVKKGFEGGVGGAKQAGQAFGDALKSGAGVGTELMKAYGPTGGKSMAQQAHEKWKNPDSTGK